MNSYILIILIIIFYNIFSHKIASNVYANTPPESKDSKIISFLAVYGIFGLIISEIFFSNKTFLYNKVVLNGLWYGNVVLIYYNTYNNWGIMDDSKKLLVIGLVLIYIILYSYKSTSNENNKKQQKNKSYNDI